jgi:hypothetical protein
MPVVGHFWDLAFDSQGELWASFQGSNSQDTGLYKIDLSTYSASPMVMVPPHMAFPGIAFGPATSQTTYCTAKTNSLGCVPAISGKGLASATATFGYTVSAANVRNNTHGVLLYGLTGRNAMPFQGGLLCVNSPKRTRVVYSDGNAPPVRDCTGVWSFDLNKHLYRHPGPGPGSQVWCQWYGRDGLLPPPNGVSLSDALELTLLP